MNDKEISEQVAEIVRDVLDDPDFEVTAETGAADHPEWDSFNHINMIIAAEVRFNIKFQTSEVESVQNVGDFVALIQRKRQAA